MILLRLALVALTLALSLPAAAQSVDRGAIWQSNHGAVVRIRTIGKLPGGAPAPPRSGSGVIVGSEGVIVTALHVVGSDDEWDKGPTNEIARKIEVTGLDEHDVSYALGEASVQPVPGRDIAILFVSAKQLATVKVDVRRPSSFASAVALLWGANAKVPDAVSADLSPTDPSKHSDSLTLRLAVVEGYSGSGVFGADGRLIGIITNKLDDYYALAIPTKAFKSQLPQDQPDAPSPDQIAACEARLRAQKADRQPFSVQNSVRCESNGDQKSGRVIYYAPDNYTIVGQVTHRDETNYGTVGAVEYYKDGDRVVKASASIACETPSRLFGPGGWAGTALTGTIERVFSQQEIESMRMTCRGELGGGDK